MFYISRIKGVCTEGRIKWFNYLHTASNRYNYRRCSVKKVLLKFLQNSQEPLTCVFLWILWNFQEQIFCRTPPGDCFWTRWWLSMWSHFCIFFVSHWKALKLIRIQVILTNIHLLKLKFNNTNIRKRSEICSNLVIDDVLVSLLLTLNIFHTFFLCFYCWIWTGNFCDLRNQSKIRHKNHNKIVTIMIIINKINEENDN